MSETSQVGNPPPDFDLPDSTGRRRTLPELLTGGNMVLVFFRGVW